MTPGSRVYTFFSVHERLSRVVEDASAWGAGLQRLDG